MDSAKHDESTAKETFRAFSVLATYRFVFGNEKRCRAIVDHGITGFPGDWDLQVHDAYVAIILQANDIG